MGGFDSVDSYHLFFVLNKDRERLRSSLYNGERTFIWRLEWRLDAFVSKKNVFALREISTDESAPCGRNS